MLKNYPKLLLTFLLATGYADAGMLNVNYTDVYGNDKSTNILNGAALNPKSAIDVLVSSGLDRRIKMTVLDENMNSVYENTSEFVTIHDRITHAQNDYYGKAMHLGYDFTDGDYTLVVEMLKLNIQTNAYYSESSENFVFNIDKTPPVINDSKIGYVIIGRGGGNIDRLGYIANRGFKLSNITDDNSLSEATFFSTHKTSGETRKLAMSLSNGVAELRKPNEKSLFPYQRSNYTIGITVSDVAGNVATISNESSFDGVCPSKVISEVWNPITAHWDTFSETMEVNANPYKFRVRVPRSEHVSTNNSVYGYNFRPSSSDDSYVYRDLTAYSPKTSTYYTFYTNHGYCGSIHQPNNVKRADGIDAAPKMTGISYFENDKWHRSSTVRRNTPYTITKVEVRVEPRSYDQEFKLNSFGTCAIPANSTSCEISGSYARDAGRGYSPLASYLRSADGQFPYGHTGYLYTYWDLTAPAFENVRMSANDVYFEVYDADTVPDWRHSMWKPSVRYLEAINLATNEQVIIDPLSNVPMAYNRWSHSFSLKHLLEGTYAIYGYVRDTYGNVRTELFNGNFIADKTAPKIQFTVEDTIVVDTKVGSFEDIRFAIVDSNEYQINKLSLAGGPAADFVNLAWRKTDINEYAPLSPRIFPSLENASKYTLTIDVEDIFGNTSVKSLRFNYEPSNLIVQAQMRSLPTVQPLFTRNDTGLTSIVSEPLKTNGGARATGLQEAFITVRSDAKYGINVNNTHIAIGETKAVDIDLGNDGRMNVVLTPDSNEADGLATYMLEIPQLKSENE